MLHREISIQTERELSVRELLERGTQHKVFPRDRGRSSQARKLQTRKGSKLLQIVQTSLEVPVRSTMALFPPYGGNIRNISLCDSRPRTVASDYILLVTSQRSEGILSRGKCALLQCSGECRNATSLSLRNKRSLSASLSSKDHVTLNPPNS